MKIAVNAKGEALFTYRKAGGVQHMLVWGAINAIAPKAGGRQAKFKLDYSGGWGSYHTLYWKTFGRPAGATTAPRSRTSSPPARRPTARYWAAQSWPQPLPNLGFTPWTPSFSAQWLEVSHWTGDARDARDRHRLGLRRPFPEPLRPPHVSRQPVYGFGTTRFGAPTDGFGSLVYLDTFNSVYGPGWRRENSFVTHNPTGVFCYGFYPFDPTKGGYKHPPGWTARRGPGTGEKYRLTASGPGVTPNVAVIVPGLHPFDKTNAADVAWQQQQSDVLLSWNDRLCRAGLS